MTAFTYRFAPSMRYLRHLLKTGALGEPRHFRSQRFLDWPETSWGWRQYKRHGRRRRPVRHDDPPHRLRARPVGADRAQSAARSPASRRATKTADGQHLPAVGRGRLVEPDRRVRVAARPACGKGPRWPRAIIATASATNGPRSTAPKARPSIGCTSRTRFCSARRATTLQPVPVPAEFLKPAGSPRDPSQGEPATVFRYDLMWEFVSAIVEGRDAVPSFYDGLNAQIVADAVLRSHAERRWIDTPGSMLRSRTPIRTTSLTPTSLAKPHCAPC